MSAEMVSLALWPFDILATPSSQPAITFDDGHYDDDDGDDGDDEEEEGDDHLLPSNVELEWLASVSRAVDLATVLIAIVMLEKQNDALGDDYDAEWYS